MVRAPMSFASLASLIHRSTLIGWCFSPGCGSHLGFFEGWSGAPTWSAASLPLWRPVPWRRLATLMRAKWKGWRLEGTATGVGGCSGKQTDKRRRSSKGVARRAPVSGDREDGGELGPPRSESQPHVLLQPKTPKFHADAPCFPAPRGPNSGP